MKKKNTFNPAQHANNLATYSALAAVFILINETSDAQVVYTDTDPDFYFTEPDAPPQYGALAIDLNNDGNKEFQFGFSSFAFNGTCYSAGSMSLYFVNYASVMVYTDASVSKVQILNEGEIISAGANWGNFSFQTIMYTDFYNNVCDAIAQYPNLNGNWLNAEEKYIGARFQLGANYYYGWIRLSSKITSAEGDAQLNVIEIFGYAYEQQADTPINAGTGYLPEAIDENEKITFSCYPNPAHEQVYVELPDADTDYLIEILDMAGNKIVEQENISAKNITLNIANISSGIYFIRVSDSEKSGYVKFVKE